MGKKVTGFLMGILLCFSFGFYLADGASAAAAKTSADFSDLQDLDAATKAKFDELISAGIFDGVSESTFGLKDEMNRAQFAKVAALIFNLKVDTSLKTSSFSDVNADDPANGYAVPFIEAVKAAGITDGVGDGVYDPAGKVTKEQLATFLIRGLGKDADARATPGVNDDTVSDWAKGYVALAIETNLMSNGADGKFGGQSHATRDLLVLGAYEAQEQYTEAKRQEEEQKKKEEEEKNKEEEKKKQEEEKKQQQNVPSSPSAPPSDSSSPPVIQPPVQSTVATPTASPSGGTVTSGTQVTLTSATATAAVYYTLDGSEPTTSSTLYVGPITITNNTTIKAIAVKSGLKNSSVASFVYTVTVSSKSSLDLINEAAASGDWTGIDESTFADAGITGVTSENVYGIQGILQDYDYPSSALPKTLNEIQTIVTETININAINNYFAYGTGNEPDKQTFENAGLERVTDQNLAGIISYLQSKYLGAGGGSGGGAGDIGGGFPGGGFPGGDPGDIGGGFPGGGFPGGGSSGPLYSGSSKQDIQAAIDEYLDSL